ncbi:hypothetical protein MTR_5g024400 [Medicago truncatula]|uniref:Uncharacterized protein n=1 Tax=Medicago truncatula TaxID=3880 RepID=G7K199_MEDTR|nr:hypothetical protein MTR_5g024400 [Medicago truncatula]
MAGNNKLCVGISHLHLPPCLVKHMNHAKHHNFHLIVVIVSVVVEGANYMRRGVELC